MVASILDFSRSNPSNGTLFDMRDGQSYKVVKIGKQIWLAENFRYLPSKEKGDKYDTSYVCNNDNSYLDKGYGRLYDYDTANNIAPEGWKLPSNEDFQELIDFIRKDNKLDVVDEIGNYLKSENGWASSFRKIKPNNDKYGFNAKPVGYQGNDSFYSEGYYANFWSVTEFNSDSTNGWSTNGWRLYYNYEDFNSFNNKYSMLSVRLIKDS
jgi:uncharacterized protein (TIGR02145 family)